MHTVSACSKQLQKVALKNAEEEMTDTNDKKFVYDVDLSETVSDGWGGTVLRYGRARKPEFRHLGSNAPFRDDGALYDRLDPLRPVMPTNVQVVKGGMRLTSMMRVVLLPDRLQFCHAPGTGAFGD